MFLVNLQNMEQRKAFCNLATALINIDGKQDEREIILLQNMVKEMIIQNDIDLEDSAAFSKYLTDNVPKGKPVLKDINKNLEVFVDVDKLIRKAVLFELTAIAYSDSDVKTTEKKLIYYIAKKLGFTKEMIIEMLKIIASLNKNFEKAANLIQG